MYADLRLALRQLAKSPGFTVVAVLSLALGIGANTAVFSLVNAALLRLLPVQAPEQLVLFSWLAEAEGGPRSLDGWSTRDPATGKSTSTSFSYPTYESFRTQTETLSDVFAFAPMWGGVTVQHGGQAEIVGNTQFASGNYHRALGAAAAAGRLLTPEDDQPSAAPVVVISYRYWQRRFAGDPAVVGQSLLVNNTPVTLVGVTAPGFAGTMQMGEHTDITLPLSLCTLRAMSGRADDGHKPDYWWIRLMGRLRPGVTAEQARASLEGLYQESVRGHLRGPRSAPDTPPDVRTMRLRVASGAQGLTESRRIYHERSLRLLGGLVGLVLLVACANVANLLLARGAARRREIAVRLSLGASRARIVVQLLSESLLLATLGAALGTVLAFWGRDALLALQPLGDGSTEIGAPLDGKVLLFTAGIAALTAVLFGLAPALKATRLNLSAEFQGGTRTLGQGSRSLLAKGLMVTQVALSLVLVIGAGLFIRTLHNLQQVDVGFARERMLLFQLNAVGNGTPTTQATAHYDRIAQRFAAVPGVQRVGYSHIPLLTGGSWSAGVNVPGYDGTSRESVRVNAIDPGFLATLGVPLLDGRGFTERDRADAPKVMLVNQAFAKIYFPHGSPIGQRVGFGRSNPAETEIVGVVRDAHYYTVKSAPPPTVYVPFAQNLGLGAAHFAVRIGGDPGAILPALRTALREVDATLPLYNVRTQEEQIDRQFTRERMFAWLCTVFGALALALAAIGLYGLMSYAVLRRSAEIGLRMALGALPQQVLRMVLRESLVLVGLGALAGLALAYGASRFVASMLFGVSPGDPLTYGAVTALLVGVALLAAALPARRAAKVDPMRALRSE